MFRRLLPALVFLATPALAQTSQPCEVTPDQTSCSRIFACLGDQGRWFQGRAFGRGEGVFDGVTDDGVLCRGTWTNSNAANVGQADMICDDGMTAVVYYFLQDGYTGTGIGQGTTNTGDEIKSWTGENVIEFLKRNSATSEALLQCGDASILIS